MVPARNRVLYGGRSSSKSWDAAGFAIYLAQTCCIRVLCARQFQNRITESVYTLLKTQIERFGLKHEFKVTNNKIVHKKTGSEFLFYGLWRDIDEIKSMEGVDILWIEEAHNLMDSQWEILEPTIRKEGSQVWVVFNPRFATDFVYQRFVVNPPPDTIVRKINYNENRFLSKTMIKIIDALRAEDEEEYEHVYLGVPRSDDDKVIIKRRWIMSCVDAYKKIGFEPSGSRRIGFDIADSGDDKNASVRTYGYHCEGVDEWKGLEDELMKSCKRVYNDAIKYKASITYDCIGVGAHAGSKFKELNSSRGNHEFKPSYFKFNAGGEVINKERAYQHNIKNKDFFSNLKAQAWWTVADRFRDTHVALSSGILVSQSQMMSISSDCDHLEKLITELSTPYRDYNEHGKVKVESKKDLLKREIKSPNLADAYIMAYAPREGGEAIGTWM